MSTKLRKDCLIERSRTNAKASNYTLFHFISILTSSCIINKHYCEYYETSLPDSTECKNMAKDMYAEHPELSKAAAQTLGVE